MSIETYDYGLFTEDRPNPREIINCQNGLLHVPTRRLLPHTPDFFTVNVTTFDYDPKATCPTWLQVMNQYWPEDPGAITLLQECFGYSLLPWTSLQKIFVVLGPGRSGKGTLMHVLTMLVGERNVAAPRFGALGTEFGAQPLLHKTLAIVGEAGFGRNDDRGAVTNFLKTVSGEDAVEINRKNKDHWKGKLLVRFWLLCNRIPEFDDGGRALGMRLVPIKMTISWADNEDEGLPARLDAEIPGIMNWALEGYDRLRRNKGKFSMPQSSIETRADVSRMASPAQSFIEDCCDVVKDGFVTEDVLYDVYEKWCEKSGQIRPLMKKRIIDEIVQSAPALIKRKRAAEGSRGDETRLRGLAGIKLRGPAPRAVSEQNPPPVGDGEIPF